MIGYVGDTSSGVLLTELRRLRGGMMVMRGRIQARTRAVRWAYDNGAWMDHVAGRAFDARQFEADCDVIAGLPTREAPDFCVLPDIVAGGLRSLDLSMSWLGRLRGVHWHW